MSLIRFTLLGALLGLWANANAQLTPSDSSSNAPAIYQPPLADLFPHFSPKSPTASALGRYGEYPVSMYTGLPTIEIPIHEFTVGTLSVPIKLSYHAAGRKVNELASWVGLGWSLQTGGLITRSVMGRPDEQGNGVLGQTINQPGYSPSCPTTATLQEASDLADGIRDSQRDMFSYRTPSGSNTFLLPSLTSAVLLNAEPVSITATAGLGSFILADASGTRFRFADGEATSSNQNTPYGSTSFTSAWHLSEIISLNTAERATYTYTTVTNLPMSPEPVYTTVVQADLNENVAGSSSVVTCSPTTTMSNAAVQIDARFPQEIQFPGGKLSFVLEAGTRLDGGKALDYIDVFSYDISTSQFALIKRFDFQYSYKTRTDNTSVTFLDGIRLLQADGTTLVGTYSFTYNSLALPAAGGNAKDYWGYYNNNTGSTLIPTQYPQFTCSYNTPGTTSVPIGDANREPDDRLMQAWMLQSISYPTGGSTQFDFEANRYTNGTLKLAGGLRVKQIRNYSAPAQLASTKTYKYGVGESGLGTFRSQINLTAARTAVLTLNNYQIAPGAPIYSYKAYSYSSSPTYPLSPDEGSPVTYAEVAEYTQDGTGNNTGKTVYQYRDAAADGYLQVGGGKAFLTSRSWDRGQLVRQTLTDASGNLRAKTENGYTSYGTGSTAAYAGVLVNRSVKQIGAKQASVTCSNWIDDVYVPILTYNFSYGTTKLTSSSEYTYADDNSGRYTLKTTETDYDAGFYLPTETRLKAEGGIILGTITGYAQHFLPVPASATSAELLGIRALQQRNAYLPIETIRYRKESTSAPYDIKTGQLTTYTPITLNGLTTAVPYKTYLLETVFNTFTGNPFQSSAQRYNTSGNNTLFPADPRQVLRLTMSSYDANGNPTGYTLAQGASTSYGYNTYTPSGGVLFSVVTGQTQNAGQTNAQTTSYTYYRPLLGPATSIDPRGVTTSYVYDNFGRLSTIKDKDGNVLKQYTYRYATQP